MAAEPAVKRREENEIEFGRIVAFSDGVFSIAITLLVLNLGIDKGLTEGQIDDALWDQRDLFFAYAISFAVIGRFWLVHHRFFSEVRAFDGRLIALNLAYLGAIVLIPFSSELLGEYGGTTTAVVFYSVNLAAVVLLGLLLHVDARRRGADQDRRPHPPRNPDPQHLYRRHLPALGPRRLLRAGSGAIPLAGALRRPFRRAWRRASGADGEGDRLARP